jgi:hypothetical protein
VKKGTEGIFYHKDTENTESKIIFKRNPDVSLISRFRFFLFRNSVLSVSLW